MFITAIHHMSLATVPDLRRKSLEEIAIFDPPLANPDADE